MIKGVIGLTGFARCGKDTLFSLISQRIPAERVSLADNLKLDIRLFLIDKFNIDILNCSPEQKELIRPLMVEYGMIHRKNSNGTYFTDKVKEKVLKLSKEKLCVITDIRYASPLYPNDELNWLKSMGGKLVHISKYFETENGKKDLEAPNLQEFENNEILFSEADYRIKWPHHVTDLSSLGEYADKLIEYLEYSLLISVKAE